MRVLVCGGREYNDRNAVFGALNEINKVTPIDCLIHGDCPGAEASGWVSADRLAGRWGHMTKGVTVVTESAKWGEHGRAAGPIRNALMIERYTPDMVIAFPGGTGTADCVRRAIDAGIKVIQIQQKKEV
jgi:hypothetical protein